MYPCLPSRTWLACSADWGNRTVVGRLSEAVRRTAVSHSGGDVEGGDP